MLDTSQYPAHCELGKLRTDVLPNLKLNGTAKQIALNSSLYEQEDDKAVICSLCVGSKVTALLSENATEKLNIALKKYLHRNKPLAIIVYAQKAEKQGVLC